MDLDARKPVRGVLPTTKGTDQPAHPISLISTFVIRLIESVHIDDRLATSKISIVLLISEQTALNLTLLETLRQVFHISSRPLVKSG